MNQQMPRSARHIDVDVIQRLAPSLETSQMAWSRMAMRWGELTTSETEVSAAASVARPVRPRSRRGVDAQESTRRTFKSRYASERHITSESRS